ncbi:MAG TPA: hypothetical protein DCS13_05000 [Candidatus Margulisbacteria bacterium]|nr:MAG: hypothetical protein A2X43_00175 [Candidatus Margulisbacteria bacterium GWD2_39_127]HAR62803.1 hypothetical protein [Candidatus Margulisiibacteriota bacterium]
MKRIYTQNISALASKYPALAKSLDDLAMPSEYQYVAAKNGQPNSKVTRDGKDYYYHSTYDPQKESSKYIQTYYADHEQQCLNAAFAIVIGLGCGYHVFDLINKVTWLRELIIIEPDMALFKTILNHVDLTELISHQKISFVLGDVNLDTFRNLHAAQWLNLGGVIIVPSLFMTNYAKEYLDKVNSLVAEFIQEKDFNARTYIKCGRPMLENQFKNIPFMFSCPPVNELFGKFEGVPCICIASGPSLNDYLEDLKKIRDKAIFICADSAFKVLIENGIKPDIVTAIDPLPGKFKYFEENSHLTKDILLVAGTTTYPGMLTSWQGPIRIMLQGSKQFGFYFEDVAYPCVERFPDFHTVALSSLMIADKLGGNPIVLVGQDLCLGKTDHAQGTSLAQSIDIIEENGKYYARDKSWKEFVKRCTMTGIKAPGFFNSIPIKLSFIILALYPDVKTFEGISQILESKGLVDKNANINESYVFSYIDKMREDPRIKEYDVWEELIKKGYINNEGKVLERISWGNNDKRLRLDKRYKRFEKLILYTLSCAFKWDSEVYPITKYDNSFVYTLPNFAFYIREFENYITKCNKKNVYNLTSSGAKINGAEQIDRQFFYNCFGLNINRIALFDKRETKKRDARSYLQIQLELCRRAIEWLNDVYIEIKARKSEKYKVKYFILRGKIDLFQIDQSAFMRLVALHTPSYTIRNSKNGFKNYINISEEESYRKKYVSLIRMLMQIQKGTKKLKNSLIMAQDSFK